MCTMRACSMVLRSVLLTLCVLFRISRHRQAYHDAAHCAAYHTLALAVFFFPLLDTLLILTNALIGVAALQNLIFRFLQSRQKVQIWLFEQTDLRIEGRIIVRLLLGVILMFVPSLLLYWQSTLLCSCRRTPAHRALTNT